MEAHIGPRLGGVKLDTFARKAEVVATFQADLLTSGRRDGRGGLSAKTVRNIMGVLHKAMDDAVKWGRIARNPLDAVDLPPWERPEMRVWSAPQQRVFVDGTADTRLGAAWRLLLLTGCRRGDLAGLRWRDVDLSAGAVTFVTTRVKAGTRTVEATPKTPGSVRRVALDAGTLNALRRWQRAQSAERLAAGAGWCTRGERSDDYVVADEVGRPYAPQTLTRWFNRESARLELPAIRLHDGRHSHATTALNDARQPVKVVSQRLGHSDVATTMRLYQHVLPRDDQRAADETAAAIFGQAVTPGVT